MLNTLSLTVDDSIATLTFNRPEAYNTFNKEMADELEALTQQISDDVNIRAVLLRGAGPLFMAGGDIQYFAEKLDTMPNGVMKIVRTLNASISNLMHMQKPAVASVHGSVAGVGISLMIACDLVIAAETTKFSTAYCGLGISPDGGAAYNLPRLVGPKVAMEWILLSEVFDAQKALQHGLINWVVPEEQLMPATEKLMLRLAKGPTRAYAAAKKLVNEAWQISLATHLENEGKAFASCSASKDFRTGVMSFLKKQKPNFLGE